MKLSEEAIAYLDFHVTSLHFKQAAADVWDNLSIEEKIYLTTYREQEIAKFRKKIGEIQDAKCLEF